MRALSLEDQVKEVYKRQRSVAKVSGFECTEGNRGKEMESLSLLLKVLWAPGEAMFLISKNPRVLAPIVFLCLCSLVTGGLVMSRLDSGELAMRAIESSPQGANMNPEAKELIRQRLNSPIAKVFTIVSSTIGPLLVVLIVGSLYFGLFSMIGREGSYKAFLAVTAFAFVPGIFRQFTAVLSAFVVPSSSIMPDELGSLSPSIFLDRDSVSPILFTAVSLVDLVSIWILALLVIGFTFITRKSMSKITRVVAVVSLFLVYALFRLGLAGIQAAFS
jgi:hypothetical protein